MNSFARRSVKVEFQTSNGCKCLKRAPKHSLSVGRPV